MAEIAPSRRRPRWLSILGGIVLFLILVYFVGSSSPFLRKVALPILSDQLHSEISVDEISLSPFSSLHLKGLTITPRGADRLASVGELRIRYGLISILQGKIQVNEITLDSPAITVVQKEGAPSNLDTLLKSFGPSSSPSATATPQVNVQNVLVRHGTFSIGSSGTNTSVNNVVLSGVEISLDSLANGGASKLKVSWSASASHPASGQISADASGSWDFSLSPQLIPTSVTGQLKVEVKKAENIFKAAQGITATLITEAGAAEVKRLELSFQRGTNGMGQVIMNGPFDSKKTEARINYEISGIGREVNGIVGGLIGLDLGDTAFAAKGRIDLAQLGNLFASNGRLDVGHLTLTTPRGKTPAIDVGLDYKFSFNASDSTALMEKFNLVMIQGGRTFLRGSFDRPMNIAWKGRGPGFRQATYQLSVDSFDLGPWKSIINQIARNGSFESGLVTLDGSISSENDGHSLKLNMGTTISQLALTFPGGAVGQGSLKIETVANWEDFASLNVEKLAIDFSNQGTQVANLLGNIHYQSSSHEFGFHLSGESAIPGLLKVVPVNGVDLTTGLGSISVQLTQRPEGIEGSVGFALSKLTGQLGPAVLSDYQIRVDSTGKLAQSNLTINRVAVALGKGFESGGSLDFNGAYDLESGRGNLTYKSVGLNQVGLGPWVAPAITPNRLVSVGLDVSGDATLDPQKANQVRADVTIKDFKAEDPGHRLPDKPLSFGTSFDVSQSGAVTDIRKWNLRLGQTSRAKNELAISGHLDLSTNNPTPSNLSVKSDELDLTALYLLLVQSSKTNVNAVAKAPASTNQVPSEPSPVSLPLRRFDFDLNLSKVFLGEIAINDWLAQLRLEQGVVTVNPFSLKYGGVPVKADGLVDLSVPGYKYAINFDGKRIPIAPTVNTLQPSIAGIVGGTFDAKVELKGAGVTGAGLQKNLNGQFEMGATNLSLKIDNVQAGILKNVLNVVVGLPDLIRNPTAALNRLTQIGGISLSKADPGKADGWVDQIQAEPLQVFHIQGKVGAGKVEVADALIQSAALRIRAPGTITLLPVLTNSPLDFAVDVGLKDSLAKKIGIDGKAGDYASLPAGCLAIRGTLGAPIPKPDTAKLVLLGGKAIVGVTGNTVSAITDILGSAVGSTNNSATNAITGALKGLEGLLGGSTNSPAKPKK